MKKHPEPRLGTNGDVIGQRILAFLLDSLIMGVVFGLLFGIGTALGDAAMLLLLLVAFAVSIVYGFLLEGIYGYTPGKYLLGLVVVKSDGSECTIGASVLRNLLWVIDSLPTFNLIAMAMILLTDDNQRVGDLVADTIVVEQR
ncbi:RDD family protein [Halopiger xanaduensis]|uniref:RDD domain containing protein n=1 Tax=Halopiger xanaduensis (strain DSM 18323 / JCM 14033 / SH-6) TaxID=797210 RepID=F8D3C2_HALXS|nr:RDD family protein [Halopiger xanaduensis]AEH38560.1 RDD domain containing protein [Halopiger xanaduensis SH-6]